jgi:hypothetical protein
MLHAMQMLCDLIVPSFKYPLHHHVCIHLVRIFAIACVSGFATRTYDDYPIFPSIFFRWSKMRL